MKGGCLSLKVIVLARKGYCWRCAPSSGSARFKTNPDLGATEKLTIAEPHPMQLDAAYEQLPPLQNENDGILAHT